MQKLTDILNDLQGRPCYSFEYFPPVTEQGMTNLMDRMDRMSALKPSWTAITWGAGGTTQERSLFLAQAASQQLGLNPCLHLTCTNMEKSKLDQTLSKAKELGIKNILALRGDPPRGDEYWVAADEQFQHAADLVRYIRKEHADHFCIGVAGYPEGHSDSEDKSQEIHYLKAKVDAGADFIVTQLFYDVDVYIKWDQACRKAGIQVPIIPGIMPVQSYNSFRRMVKLCDSAIPDQILDDLEPIKNDDVKVKEYGVQLAIDMVKKLQESGINTFHFCTLNLEKSVKQIINGLGWLDYPVSNGKPAFATPLDSPQPTPSNRLIAQWDEHPNGRFGDSRSPAYGELDGWGVSLKTSPVKALQIWGRPTSTQDISTIFASYLQNKVDSLPWSDMPLMDETAAIVPHLLRLTKEKHWWTVGSQPAIDGVSSEDAVYGFGPKGGYIYQKAFVEFWVEEEQVQKLAKKMEERKVKSGVRELTFYAAGKAEGQFLTNMEKGDANAVTWGIFPGKEIITTTLIEEMSFKSWKEEALSIWNEWELLYPPKSATRQLLRELGEKRWLISIVHHDFKSPDALWNFLLD